MSFAVPSKYESTSRGARSRRLRPREWLAAPGLIVAVALFIVAFDNHNLWAAVARATALDEHRQAIFISLFSIVFFSLTTLLALALGNRVLKTASVALLLVAAVCSFFMGEYGIVIDESMIRNIVETEAREAAPLLSWAFAQHVLFFGLAPAIAVLFMPLERSTWRHHLLVRLVAAVGGLGIMVGTVYGNFGAVSFFGHQQHQLRMLINPGYPLYAAVRFGLAEDEPVAQDRAPLEARLVTRSSATKPAVVIVVMGETARADRFSFNGYERDTNRYTRELGVVNFPHVTSCGTSTADSVPCVFSHLGKERFTHAAAAQHESLLGMLSRLGVKTAWRDNSTGCKEVCAPADFEQLATRTDADFCDATGCFDEILLKDLDALLLDKDRDHLIVFHQRGSHGPAYNTDAPTWIKEFKPECDLPNLRNCDREAINNAYDNTILYTDYFVSRVITALQARSREFDTAVLYVSDHGESLGENGLYLHGFPYALAPQEQIRIPMLFWASPDFYARRAGIEPDCLRTTANRGTTHDAVFHTLLRLFGVQSPSYDANLDLFEECRQRSDVTTNRSAPTRPDA